MSKIKFGILGGTRGIDFLTRVLRDHPLAEVTAICESFPALREKIVTEANAINTQIKVFADFDEFIQSGIDAVISHVSSGPTIF